MIKARSPFFIEHEEPAAPVELPRFTCADTQISGLSIAADGTITNPTVSVGTLHSIEPSSFGISYVPITRTMVVYVTYDATNHRPPTSSSDEIGCTVQFTQPATPFTPINREFTVTNHSTTENASVTYYNTSQVYQTETISPSTTITICIGYGVYNEVYMPSLSGSNVTYFQTGNTCT